MSKKKSAKNRPAEFASNPFRTLKGFAASAGEETPAPEPPRGATQAEAPARTFAEEMRFLGVAPLAGQPAENREGGGEGASEGLASAPEPDDESLFLDSLGQLDVSFSDRFPDSNRRPQPRRLKQLRQGRLTPDASLDLHGLQRHQVAEKIGHFLQNAVHRQWRTLLLVTGRGLHSAEGRPVLRAEAERYLETDAGELVAEWSRAPRQYGGAGALVVFLKKTTQGKE